MSVEIVGYFDYPIPGFVCNRIGYWLPCWPEYRANGVRIISPEGEDWGPPERDE